ncbi:MAG TPA: DUF4149 domain-containing protein [Nitrospiria bacterium]|nr:DUF4149 domain-containing protein [Nitrospiria bacterium]
MIIIIRFLHLLSLVVWIGGMIFFSFIGAPSIFKVLPRDKAGDLVGDIFPKYWMMGYVCSAIALLTILILSFQEQGYNLAKITILALMSGLNLYSGMVVGAKAREVKARIRSAGDTKEAETLKYEFNRVHRRSTILNSIILILGLVVIFITSASPF